jgi:predicted lipoprotein with Yx(FWY)xxD motif
MRRAFVLAVPAALAALLFATAPAAAPPRPPVIKLSTKAFGNVLASRSRLPLYYWNVEKKAGGKIRCTGSCAKAWPPLVLRKGARVPTRIAGIRGRFGAVRRPDGRRQLTFRGLALYTYVHDSPGVVLCDNVNGWFVVKLR